MVRGTVDKLGHVGINVKESGIETGFFEKPGFLHLNEHPFVVPPDEDEENNSATVLCPERAAE